MSTLKFKTNINCTGCLSKVTPVLNGENEIKNWEVDLENKDKVLSVDTTNKSAAEISAIVQKAGFKAEAI
ncbi:MAG: heavy-metal-associated domain-containing protein [Vicingaceae bacterium]